jgi:hypothetical protein
MARGRDRRLRSPQDIWSTLNPEPLAVRHNPNRYADLLTDILPILWRRLAIYVALVLTSAAAFLFYRTVGERHESYALLRVEQKAVIFLHLVVGGLACNMRSDMKRADRNMISDVVDALRRRRWRDDVKSWRNPTRRAPWSQRSRVGTRSRRSFCRPGARLPATAC